MNNEYIHKFLLENKTQIISSPPPKTTQKLTSKFIFSVLKIEYDNDKVDSIDIKGLRSAVRCLATITFGLNTCLDSPVSICLF